jgi:hypothetical protein
MRLGLTVGGLAGAVGEIRVIVRKFVGCVRNVMRRAAEVVFAVLAGCFTSAAAAAALDV